MQFLSILDSESYMFADAYREQKGMPDPLEFDLQAVVSGPTWDLKLGLL